MGDSPARSELPHSRKHPTEPPDAPPCPAQIRTRQPALDNHGKAHRSALDPSPCHPPNEWRSHRLALANYPLLLAGSLLLLHCPTVFAPHRTYLRLLGALLPQTPSPACCTARASPP